MKKMICKKCKKENILDAKYCIKCGNEFSKKERNEARRFTFVGLLETMDNIENIKCFAIIKKNKIFRIIVLVTILLIGAINIFINGYNMKLNRNDNYSIMHYNDTYYIIVDKEKTAIDLYVPKRIEFLQVELVGDKVSDEPKRIEKNETIELFSNDEKSYYIINGINNNSKDSIKVKIIYEPK